MPCLLLLPRFEPGPDFVHPRKGKVTARWRRKETGLAFRRLLCRRGGVWRNHRPSHDLWRTDWPVSRTDPGLDGIRHAEGCPALSRFVACLWQATTGESSCLASLRSGGANPEVATTRRSTGGSTSSAQRRKTLNASSSSSSATAPPPTPASPSPKSSSSSSTTAQYRTEQHTLI